MTPISLRVCGMALRIHSSSPMEMLLVTASTETSSMAGIFRPFRTLSMTATISRPREFFLPALRLRNTQVLSRVCVDCQPRSTSRLEDSCRLFPAAILSLVVPRQLQRHPVLARSRQKSAPDQRLSQMLRLLVGNISDAPRMEVPVP
jgi:hypothetical protein